MCNYYSERRVFASFVDNRKYATAVSGNLAINQFCTGMWGGGGGGGRGEGKKITYLGCASKVVLKGGGRKGIVRLFFLHLGH